ncbi:MULTISPECIES: hypothetical protein [Treponema]|nr:MULTISPECIES: hypothetical protein [Treponema]
MKPINEVRTSCLNTRSSSKKNAYILCVGIAEIMDWASAKNSSF